MRIYFDTEFVEDGKTIDLISIGMVSDDGRQFYAENSECDLSKASPWVAENVVSKLDGPNSQMTRAEIAAAVIAFAGEKPEFWAYYADYDWVVLCQLYGTMMALPQGWPMFCMDVKQWCMQLGNPKLPEQARQEHNALSDAAWTKEAHDFLASRA